MKLIAVVTVSVFLLAAQTERPASRALPAVTAVRHWSLSDVTRVAIEVSGDFHFVSERLHNPERIYFDISNTKLRIDSRRVYAETLEDKRVKRIRVAETLPGVTRVVLDLLSAVDASASQLTNPNRLMIELRAGSPGQGTTVTDAPPVIATAPAPSAMPSLGIKPELLKPELPKAAAKPAATRPELSAAKTETPTTRTETPAPKTELSAAKTATPSKKFDPPAVKMDPAADKADAIPEPPSVEPSKGQLAKANALEKLVRPNPPNAPPAAAVEPVIPSPLFPPPPSEVSKAARHTADGQTSLVRALGLKVGRVVIDPGHGGHDHGTQGSKGLLEKDLVLDVAKRVGKLVEDRMGAEVVYTRSDDTFIPLEGRTTIANDRKADLFLSIHANSSPLSRIEGVETYYLNFTESKEALDVASRENASSQKSIFELRDIIQKITLHDKAEESRDFAARIQTALYGFSSRSFPASKNRGVKKAPFVVLIGANMPSVLAEIGFLSNPREEALLKKPDYRQRLADALFRGLSRYADSLSHFQVAQAKE